MSVIRIAKREKFTVLRNEMLEDPRLSFAAKGLLAWMLSKPDDWAFASERTAKVGPNKRDAVRAMMNELQEAGYARVVRSRKSDGTWTSYTEIYESPGQTGDGFPGVGESGDIPKTENQELTHSRVEPEEDTFESFWSMFPRKVAKKTCAKAYARALRENHAPEVIEAGLARWVDYWRDSKTDERFTPHPSTWLNGERWNDTPPDIYSPAVQATGDEADAVEAADVFARDVVDMRYFMPSTDAIGSLFVRMRKMGFDSGETAIRFAVALRRIPTIDPYNPIDLSRISEVSRFSGPPEAYMSDEVDWADSMRRAFNLQRWSQK